MAVKYDSRLENVEIVPERLDETGDNQKPFFARRPWKTESGKAEVHILFGDSNIIERKATETVTEDMAFKDQVRQMLHAPRGSKMNRTLIRGVIFLHELGHVADFYDHLNDPDGFDAGVQAEKDSLPLGYVSGEMIKARFNSGDAEFQRKVISLFGSLEKAVSSYRRLRHELSFEKKADVFAKNVLAQDATALIGLATYTN